MLLTAFCKCLFVQKQYFGYFSVEVLWCVMKLYDMRNMSIGFHCNALYESLSVCSCVFVDLMCLFCCLNTHIYSPIENHGLLNNDAQSTKRGKAKYAKTVGSSSSRSPHNPPALTCQSKTDWLTSDFWSLCGILIGSPAACGLLIHRLSHTSNTHTQTHLRPVCGVCVCVWFCDRSLEDFFDFFFFFLASLYCMDDPSYCDEVFQKRF